MNPYRLVIAFGYLLVVKSYFGWHDNIQSEGELICIGIFGLIGALSIGR